jgi:glycosyltransferase involved in cell wall biosynthesis
VRILIIQPWIRAGGAELLSVELSALLEAGGDEAPIAALFVRPHGLPAAATARRYVLPPRPLAAVFERSRTLALTVGPLVLLALSLRAARHADVLNPHNVPGPFVAAIAGRLLRRPIVWTCNEVPSPLPASEARTLGPMETIAWRAASLLARFAARVPQEILVLSDKTRSAVRDAYARDATVIRAGVDLDAFRADHARRKASFALLYVAKLHPQKEPLLAIETLAVIRAQGVDATLTIVGDGPLRDAVVARTEALGLRACVRFERDLELLALVDRYRNADVLLVTAGGHQSWGLTPFEALAAGTPAVISRDAGAAEVLASHGAALVVERTSAAFAGAALRLRDDTELAERIVVSGQRLITELTWSAYAAACRAAYVRALGRA